MGAKKSDFVGQTTAADDATFDFVSLGQNIKIRKDDLVKLFGTTGSLEQLGLVTATPILNKSGTTNQIRNIEDGQGVKAEVSPNGGAQINHNLVNGATGTPLIVDNPDKTTLIKSLVAGSGMNVSTVGDTAVLTATDIVAASNVVIINSMSDFPAPSGGVITLAADTGYLVSANLTTADRFMMGSKTVVFASDRFVAGLTYTGTGTMFTGVNISQHIKDLTLDAPNGKLFSASSTLGSGDLFLFDNITITSCDELGDLTGMDGMRFQNLTIRNIITNGISFTGTNGVLLVTGLLDTVNGGSMLDLGTATFNSLSCDSCFSTLAGGTFFTSGTAASANITAGNLGSITNSRFFGAGTPLQNITVDDVRWEFAGNDDIADTRPDGLLSLQGNATTTTIAVAGTYVLVAGTWVVADVSQSTGTVGGRITYDGQQDSRMPITASITVEPVSGVNIGISARVAFNGVTVAGSERPSTASAGSPTSITLPWQETFATTNFVEIFVTNDDNTTDLLVSSAVLRVN